MKIENVATTNPTSPTTKFYNNIFLEMLNN